MKASDGTQLAKQPSKHAGYQFIKPQYYSLN